MMQNEKRYSMWVLGWTILFLGLLAAFNFVIDPYKLLHTRDRDGLNAKKTEIFYHLGTTKAYQFYNSGATSLILGSSRAGRAIDPDHPTLRGQHFYNFATPGAPPQQDYLKLRSAIATRKVERIIYFVDFFTFNAFYTLPADYMKEFRNRLSRNNSIWSSPVFVRQALVDFGGNFWAFSTLRDSVRTIRNQAAADAGELQYTVLNPGGSWKVVMPSNRRLLYAYKSVENSYLRETWFSPNSLRFSIHGNEAAPNKAFDDFAALLSLAHANGIETTVVILPVHARLLEVLSYAGLWESFEFWKRQLVTTNESVARARGQLPFDLWDFNGYYPITSEAVSTRPLEWFYDSAHASVSMGNRILDIIAGNAVADFGGKIDVNNIDNWLQIQRDLRDAYRIANPQTSEQLRRHVNKIRQQTPWEVAPPPDSELVVNKLTDTEHPH
jgi:hypothetical protein